MMKSTAIRSLRSIRSTRLFSLIYLVLSLAAPGWGQAKPDFLGLQKALARLKGSPIGSSDPKSVDDVHVRVDEFQRHLQEAHAASPDDAAAIQHLTSLLILAANQPDTVNSDAILADVSRDLVLKNRFYSERMGVAGESRSMVKVTVRTLSGTQPAAGLLVFCNPYRWADSVRPMKTFAALSSPTDTTMLPGYYRCAAAQPLSGNIVGDRLIEIGLDGKDSVTLDIAVKK